MNAYYKGQPVLGPRGPAGPDGNPIGTIISFMGASAPKDYLVCDGAEYSISQYPALASFFQTQFGSASRFGGDGTATFAVPDLRNLFLRGYHGGAEEQLSGEVGERQEATLFPDAGTTETSNATGAIYIGNSDPHFGNYRDNADTINGLGTTKASAIIATSHAISDNHKAAQSYTARPVNAAVLYCIKAIPSGPALEEYDTDSGWHVWRWPDGYIELVRTLSWEATNWVNWNVPYLKFAQEGGLPLTLSEIYSLDFYIRNESAPEGEESGTIVTTNRIQKNGDCLVVLYSLGTSARSYEVSEKITGRWK